MALIIEAPKPLTRILAAIQRHVNIVFFGTPQFAVPTLRLLNAEGWPIRAVVTSPDKPVGRRMLLTPSAVKSAATELGLETFTPTTLRDDTFFPTFETIRPDICVVVAYGKIIPERYLAVPRLGFINVHPSLLPAYRGPSPIQSAILDGCANTGVTIMQLDAEMDHGPILAAQPWAIPSGFDAKLCEDELSRMGARLLADTLTGVTDGTILPVAQQHSLATYCAKFERKDGRLDWTQDAQRIVNRIRALAANPGTWTTWNDRQLSIHHAHLYHGPVGSDPVGTVRLQGDEVVISCGNEAVALEVMQLEGSTRQNARDFLNGHPSFVGGILL
jgi:methionyl-tRNA formyltransferase